MRDPYSLNGKTALVTGAARGIGLETIRALTNAGAQVFAWDKQFGTEFESLGKAVSSTKLDITNADEVTQASKALLDKVGSIDVLINNAGIGGKTRPLVSTPLGEWEQIMAVNLSSIFRLSSLLLPAMIEKKWGRIINIASTAALRGLTNSAAYSASKAGVLGLSMSLAKEVGPYGITVNCVAPGAIETDMLSSMGSDNSLITDLLKKVALQRLGQPAEVANTIAWIASPACSFTTGAVFDVSGGRTLN